MKNIYFKVSPKTGGILSVYDCFDDINISSDTEQSLKQAIKKTEQWNGYYWFSAKDIKSVFEASTRIIIKILDTQKTDEND